MSSHTFAYFLACSTTYVTAVQLNINNLSFLSVQLEY